MEFVFLNVSSLFFKIFVISYIIGMVDCDHSFYCTILIVHVVNL